MTTTITRPAPAKPIRIAYLLVPQFPLMSFAAAIEPMRSANRMSERHLFEWTLVSVEGAEVAASNGIRISVDCRLDQLKSIDLLVVCAGLEPAQFGPKHAVHHQLRRLARHGAMIGGMSTGSFVLADAGLLTDRRCTVHWEYADWFQSRYPSIALSRDLYVVDRNIFTCSGGTAALDMMLHFVAQAAGAGIATAVAEQFIHSQIRSQDAHQRLAMHARYRVGSPKLAGIIKLMEDAVENPLDIRELARLVGISARQVERLFREQLGMSPKVFYLKLRLARARTLLRQTVDPIVAVAVECGFASTSHFSHAYKRLFGIPPTQERRSVTARNPSRTRRKKSARRYGGARG
ncbi:MAG: GlxA family transcriptional regulator [Steroidobacteraceae bacterium]|jgi:transcriptional regulator GlxA family with amidase domain